MKKILFFTLFSASTAVMAVDYQGLAGSVDSTKAIESVDKQKAMEAAATADYKKAYDSVDKPKAVESVDHQKALEALSK
ncbi:MAG: hypothetical protein DRQ61_12475 [Gammaproteobacteria bacterium]|nr:MAG: hypothetical protein DRQ56_08075 [Gammaproteobacteria bacterium]RLA18809.1 MAG: hypothetical protein DRQ61_12475 [Gammaproteobacteria bacterium]